MASSKYTLSSTQGVIFHGVTFGGNLILNDSRKLAEYLPVLTLSYINLKTVGYYLSILAEKKNCVVTMTHKNYLEKCRKFFAYSFHRISFMPVAESFNRILTKSNITF